MLLCFTAFGPSVKDGAKDKNERYISINLVFQLSSIIFNVSIHVLHFSSKCSSYTFSNFFIDFQRVWLSTTCGKTVCRWASCWIALNQKYRLAKIFWLNHTLYQSKYAKEKVAFLLCLLASELLFVLLLMLCYVLPFYIIVAKQSTWPSNNIFVLYSVLLVFLTLPLNQQNDMPLNQPIDKKGQFGLPQTYL